MLRNKEMSRYLSLKMHARDLYMLHAECKEFGIYKIVVANILKERQKSLPTYIDFI